MIIISGDDDRCIVVEMFGSLNVFGLVYFNCSSSLIAISSYVHAMIVEVQPGLDLAGSPECMKCSYHCMSHALELWHWSRDGDVY